MSYKKKPIFEIHEFPELLSANGHEVTFFEFDEGRKFWTRENSEMSSEITGRVVREAKLRLERPFQLGIPGVDRILAIFSSLPNLWKLINVQKFDAIVLYAVPTYGIQTILLAKLAGTPVLFRALDVSHKIRSSLLSPLIKSVEKFVYRNSDIISANNPEMEKYCRRLSSRAISSVVHYPPLDLKHFRVGNRNQALRESLGISDDEKLIVYMGSFFYFSGLPEALTAFASKIDEKSKLKLLLIGGGEQSQALIKLANELGVSDRVIFTGFVDYEELPRYLALAHVGINTLKPSLVANTALPNKVLQYLAAGLPVVSTRLSGLFSVFSESTNIVWGDSPSVVIEEAQEILAGSVNPAFRQASTVGNSNLERFSRENTLRAFESALLELS